MKTQHECRVPAPPLPLPQPGRVGRLEFDLDFAAPTSDFGRSRSAFTVLEMLVVLGIIAAVLAIGLPALKSLGQGNELEDALRRLRSDLGQARQMAISRHTTVAVVFAPPELLGLTQGGFQSGPEWSAVKALKGGIYSHYAFVALRRPGDQPGNPALEYLSSWKGLPAKTFLDTNLFASWAYSFARWPLPLPYETSSINLALPYVAFNHQGRLVKLAAFGSETETGADMILPVTRGAIMYVRGADGDLAPGDVTVQEVPPGFSTNTPNRVVVEWMTGRARIEQAEVQ